MSVAAATMYSASVVFALICVTAADGQPLDDGSRRCGSPGQRVHPNNLTFISDAPDGTTTMRVQHGGSYADGPIRGLMSRVEDVCAVPGGRLAVFGQAGGGLYNVSIVDEATGRLDDSLYGWNPALSPDGQWLIRRKFYPAHSDGSEEYLVYDTSGGAAGNRAPGVAMDDMDAVGRAVYPVVGDLRPFENVGLPEGLTHTFRSGGFYWAGDSRAVAFADSVQGALSVVLVSLDSPRGAAYVHTVASADVCSGPVAKSEQTQNLRLADATLNAPGDGPVLTAEFTSSESGCKPKELTLAHSDFTRATAEVHRKRGRKLSLPANP